MSPLLSQTQIQEQSRSIPEWAIEGKELKLTKKFKGFVEAVEFVNRLVDPAERSGHHPDLEISYNTVKVSLTSHDAGGLTEKDFALAKIISSLD
ncbi:MAG: 4a-hydroxytetrahydrobiopterin dehydratase [Oscillatoriales cyanobacterium RM2_1_1]|nr:4a-hydroxytetrahydrobiopterin dehydratase [Oscillatoriales cyanobacterium SM2_3_0]NJO45729.1 4a-hydroxytetrahydrobiopterin dehydratase [Oscillatoriales cyanobacterium RM2_1_1]